MRAHNPPIKRAAIDAAIWRYFERVALDVETTRRTVVEHAARKLAEFDALRQQAELELARAESALTRIESDYIAGKISAEKWTHLEDRLTGEMDASRAQAEQQERHHQAIANEIAQFDAEAVIAEELSAMRTAVAAQVQEGAKSDVDSFRATPRRLFVGFELCSAAKPFGSGALRDQGDVWSKNTQQDDAPPLLAVESGYQLLPWCEPSPAISV